jgi:tyrosyl-tRNA synthetase
VNRLLRHTVVAEECDDKVVTKGQKVHSVPKKVRHPVITRDERHKKELQDVEEYPKWQEGSNGYLKAVLAKLHAEMTEDDKAYIEAVSELKSLFTASGRTEETLPSLAENSSNKKVH